MSLTDITVANLLAKAAAKGIKVRVILDQNSERGSNTPAYDFLTEHKVPVHWANPSFAVTHQKTITVDQATSAIMTLNLTPTYYTTSRDFAVITNNAADVSAAIETKPSMPTFQTTAHHCADRRKSGLEPKPMLSILLRALSTAQRNRLLLAQEEFARTHAPVGSWKQRSSAASP